MTRYWAFPYDSRKYTSINRGIVNVTRRPGLFNLRFCKASRTICLWKPNPTFDPLYKSHLPSRTSNFRYMCFQTNKMYMPGFIGTVQNKSCPGSRFYFSSLQLLQIKADDVKFQRNVSHFCLHSLIFHLLFFSRYFLILLE